MSREFQRAYINTFVKLTWLLIILAIAAEVGMIWSAITLGFTPGRIWGIAYITANDIILIPFLIWNRSHHKDIQ